MRRVLIVAALAALPIACSDGSEEPMGDLATRVGGFLDMAGLESYPGVERDTTCPPTSNWWTRFWRSITRASPCAETK